MSSFAAGFGVGSNAVTQMKRTRLAEKAQSFNQGIASRQMMLTEMEFYEKKEAQNLARYGSALKADSNERMATYTKELQGLEATEGTDLWDAERSPRRIAELKQKLANPLSIANESIANLIRKYPGFSKHVEKTFNLTGKRSPTANKDVDPDNPLGPVVLTDRGGKLSAIPTLNMRNGTTKPFTDDRSSRPESKVFEEPMGASDIDALIPGALSLPVFNNVYMQQLMVDDTSKATEKMARGETSSASASRTSSNQSASGEETAAASDGQEADTGSLPPTSAPSPESTDLKIGDVGYDTSAYDESPYRRAPDDTPILGHKTQEEEIADGQDPGFYPDGRITLDTQELANDVIEFSGSVLKTYDKAGAMIKRVWNNWWGDDPTVEGEGESPGLSDAAARKIQQRMTAPSKDVITDAAEVEAIQSQADALKVVGPEGGQNINPNKIKTREDMVVLAGSTPRVEGEQAQQVVTSQIQQRSQEVTDGRNWQPTSRDALLAAFATNGGMWNGEQAMNYLQTGEAAGFQMIPVGQGKVAVFGQTSGKVKAIEDFGRQAWTASEVLKYKTDQVKFESAIIARDTAKIKMGTAGNDLMESQHRLANMPIEERRKEIKAIKASIEGSLAARNIKPGDEDYSRKYALMLQRAEADPDVDPTIHEAMMRGLDTTTKWAIDYQEDNGGVYAGVPFFWMDEATPAATDELAIGAAMTAHAFAGVPNSAEFEDFFEGNKLGELGGYQLMDASLRKAGLTDPERIIMLNEFGSQTRRIYESDPSELNIPFTENILGFGGMDYGDAADAAVQYMLKELKIVAFDPDTDK